MPRRLTPAGAKSRRIPVLHPLLFAVYPILFLFARNVGEVRPGQVVVPLLIALAGAAAVLVFSWAIVRDLRRAGLMTTIIVLAVSTFGYLAAALSGVSEVWLLVAWTLLAAALVWRSVRARNTREATIILNVLAAGLVAVSLVTVAGPTVATVIPNGHGGGAGSVDNDGDETSVNAPDIYYLVFDRYGAASTLQREFGFDNGPFLDFLDDQGFVIADDSQANYLKTAQSLASSLNMSYHHEELAQRYGPESNNQLPVYERIGSHAVGKQLQDRGYTYVHIGSWWDPTQTNEMADVVWSYGGHSDFVEVLIDSSVVPTALGFLDDDRAEIGHRQRHYEAALAQFERLSATRQLASPKFVFAHVLLPHEPYVFDAGGSYVTADQEAHRSRAENFTGQLRYLNTRIRDLVAQLLAGDDDPVIVIQADEGPHPVRYTSGGTEYDWGQAPTEDLHEKFDILNAYYLPGIEGSPLYDSITPVNSFRLILNAYFDAGYELLEDRSYVFRDTQHVYDYTEITERLR